jgi:hypothetical protein
MRPLMIAAVLLVGCVAPPGAGQSLEVDAASAAEDAAPLARLPERRVVRGGVGAGLSTAGLSVGIELAVHSGERLYKGRLTAHDNLGGGWAPGKDRELVAELGLLYGAGHRFNRNYGLAAAGLALVTVEDRGDRQRGTVGIPVEAQLISGGPLRLGIAAFGNLNPLRPFAGALLSVQLGGVPYARPR